MVAEVLELFDEVILVAGGVASSVGLNASTALTSRCYGSGRLTRRTG